MALGVFEHSHAITAGRASNKPLRACKRTLFDDASSNTKGSACCLLSNWFTCLSTYSRPNAPSNSSAAPGASRTSRQAQAVMWPSPFLPEGKTHQVAASSKRTPKSLKWLETCCGGTACSVPPATRSFRTPSSYRNRESAGNSRHTSAARTFLAPSPPNSTLAPGVCTMDPPFFFWALPGARTPLVLTSCSFMVHTSTHLKACVCKGQLSSCWVTGLAASPPNAWPTRSRR